MTTEMTVARLIGIMVLQALELTSIYSQIRSSSIGSMTTIKEVLSADPTKLARPSLWILALLQIGVRHLERLISITIKTFITKKEPILRLMIAVWEAEVQTIRTCTLCWRITTSSIGMAVLQKLEQLQQPSKL